MQMAEIIANNQPQKLPKIVKSPKDNWGGGGFTRQGKWNTVKCPVQMPRGGNASSTTDHSVQYIYPDCSERESFGSRFHRESVPTKTLISRLGVI